jgi:allophanate hydrolase subunit 2
MWKLGQMVPGRDHIRFKELSIDEAAELARATDALIDESNLERV